MYFLVFFGKYCLKDGSGRKLGVEGLIVCFFCLVLFELVVGGLKVNVVWGLIFKVLRWNFLLWVFVVCESKLSLGKKEVLGNFFCVESLSFL